MTIQDEDEVSHLTDAQRLKLLGQVRKVTTTAGDQVQTLGLSPPYHACCAHCFYRVAATEFGRLMAIYLAAALLPDETTDEFMALILKQVAFHRKKFADEEADAAREAEAAKLKVH